STDGGTTWRRTSGTPGSWSSTWTPTANGFTTIKVRGVDDSAKIQSSPTTIVVQTGSGCPCTIWPASTVPGRIEVDDNSAVENGVRFRADFNGTINGIRFYKAASNTGTHVGSLWSNTGTLLAQATFNNETASGWQQ